jgi:hypothetical protein
VVDNIIYDSSGIWLLLSIFFLSAVIVYTVTMVKNTVNITSDISGKMLMPVILSR